MRELTLFEFFRDHSNTSLSPSMIFKALREKWPLTSIRRSITNLTNKSKMLIKLNQKVTGIYGQPEGLWIYKK